MMKLMDERVFVDVHYALENTSCSGRWFGPDDPKIRRVSATRPDTY